MSFKEVVESFDSFLPYESVIVQHLFFDKMYNCFRNYLELFN